MDDKIFKIFSFKNFLWLNNLPRHIKSFIVKENNIGPAVSEILSYRQKDILLLLYIKAAMLQRPLGALEGGVEFDNLILFFFN